MFVACFSRTMRGAVPVVDTGIDLRRRRLPIVIAPPVVVSTPEPEEEPVNVVPLVISAGRTLATRVAAWHGLTFADLIGTDQHRPIIAARFDAIAAVYLNCRNHGRKYSLPELGRLFGGRDHTTILSSLRKRSALDRRYEAPK